MSLFIFTCTANKAQPLRFEPSRMSDTRLWASTSRSSSHKDSKSGETPAACMTTGRSKLAQRCFICENTKSRTDCSARINPMSVKVSIPAEKDNAPDGKKLSANCSARRICGLSIISYDFNLAAAQKRLQSCDVIGPGLLQSDEDIGPVKPDPPMMIARIIAHL